MKYTSISRNFRGFNVQSDWDSIDDWSASMMRQAKEYDEVDWSVLIGTIYGDPVRRYNRGAGIKMLEFVEIRGYW